MVELGKPTLHPLAVRLLPSLYDENYGTLVIWYRYIYVPVVIGGCAGIEKNSYFIDNFVLICQMIHYEMFRYRYPSFFLQKYIVLHRSSTSTVVHLAYNFLEVPTKLRLNQPIYCQDILKVALIILRV